MASRLAGDHLAELRHLVEAGAGQHRGVGGLAVGEPFGELRRWPVVHFDRLCSNCGSSSSSDDFSAVLQRNLIVAMI